MNRSSGAVIALLVCMLQVCSPQAVAGQSKTHNTTEQVKQIHSILQSARQASATLPDSTDKATVLGSIAQAQAKAGDVPGALETAAIIPDSSRKADALGDVAQAQAQAGDVQGALAWTAKLSSDAEKTRALLGIAQAMLMQLPK